MEINQRSPYLALLGTALVLGIGLAFYFFPFADALQRLSYDLPFVVHRKSPPINVVMVYLDEESARTLNQPLNDAWDRSLHTRLLDRLAQEGARMVYYDIVFSSSSVDPATDAALA